MNSLLEYGMFIIMLMRLQINCDNYFLQMMKQWKKKEMVFKKKHTCKIGPQCSYERRIGFSRCQSDEWWDDENTTWI
jgi:hypothetical protein